MNGMKKGTKIVLVGLLVLLSACEKELLPKNGGEKVAVIFSASSGGYDAPEAVRSFSGKERTVASASARVKDDFYLFMKLVEDADIDADELRATNSPLIEGQALHLEAYYVSSGLLAGAADYHVNAAGIPVLDDPDSPLELDPADGPFDFRAYSYYQSTDAISTTDIDPTVSDLIWGETLNQAIDETEAGRTVTILLKHCFSKVRVKLSVGEISNAAITALGTVTVGTGQKVDLDVADGSLTASGTAVTQTVSGWVDANGDAVNVAAPFSKTALWSGYGLFYPSPTKVTISSITVTIGGVAHAFSGLSAAFAEALDVGKHYTLVVDLKKVIFASSNIFWQGVTNTGDPQYPGYLTFLDNGSGSGYQGVFFRWGALVAASPYGGTYGGDVWNNVTVYVPNTNDGTWTNPLKKNGGVGLGNPIATGIFTDRSENYLYDHPDFGNRQGDICSYLTGKPGVPAGNWRMPNSAEFGADTDYSTNTWGSVSISGSGEDQVAGKGTPNGGQSYYASSVAPLFFPAGGYRTPDSEAIQINGHGYYWSGTPYTNTTHAYGMSPNSGDVTALDVEDRWLAIPVRCVKI
jgi:hypothetical protein